MSHPIRTFYQKGAIVLGVTIKTRLGVHNNPTNGVKCAVFDPAGEAIKDYLACTQGRYNEQDTSTAGQYYYIAQTSDTWDTGPYRVDFLVDDSGTYPDYVKYDPFFRLASSSTST